ncbi:MAG: hypothetical protein ACOVS5_15175 [Oligoflexus sp.]|jgi:hypothetical protein
MARHTRTAKISRRVDGNIVITNPIHPLFGLTIKEATSFTRLGERHVLIAPKGRWAILVPAWSTDLVQPPYDSNKAILGIFTVDGLIKLKELIGSLCSNHAASNLAENLQPGCADETVQGRSKRTQNSNSGAKERRKDSRDFGQDHSQTHRRRGR